MSLDIVSKSLIDTFTISNNRNIDQFSRIRIKGETIICRGNNVNPSKAGNFPSISLFPLPPGNARSKRKDILDSAYLRLDRVSKRGGNRHLSLLWFKVIPPPAYQFTRVQSRRKACKCKGRAIVSNATGNKRRLASATRNLWERVLSNGTSASAVMQFSRYPVRSVSPSFHWSRVYREFFFFFFFDPSEENWSCKVRTNQVMILRRGLIIKTNENVLLCIWFLSKK